MVEDYERGEPTLSELRSTDHRAKKMCTCPDSGTCKRKGKPFPDDWSWKCKQLPYLQAWRPASESSAEVKE
jgi:hypothetical protein